MGLGIGAAYGLIRPTLGEVSTLRAGVVLGLAATAGSAVPATALGIADPCEWGLNAWVSDPVPHLAYGLTTAIAHDAIASCGPEEGGEPVRSIFGNGRCFIS